MIPFIIKSSLYYSIMSKLSKVYKKHHNSFFSHIFRLLVLLDQQSKRQKYSIHDDIKHKKQQVLRFEKLQPVNVPVFLFVCLLKEKSIT